MTEKRSRASLTQELEATNKTVNRLSGRVRGLEIELARLKNILKRSVLLPISNNPDQNITSTDGSGFIQQNHSQSTDREIISITSDSSGDEGEEETMEIESVDELQNGSHPSDDENFEESLVSTPELVLDVTEVFAEDDDNHDHDDSPMVGQIRIKSPAQLFSDRNGTAHLGSTIWTHFRQTNMVAKGKSTIVMICKYCEGQVRARLDLLENHLGKCGMYKSGTLMSIEQMPTEITLDSIPHSSSSSGRVHVEKRKGKNKAGRKRHQLWQHFNTYPTGNHSGNRLKDRYEFISVCKGCNEQIIKPKLDKIRLHMKECISRRSNH